MRIHFISAPVVNKYIYGYIEKHPSPPLGIMYLASYLEKYCNRNIIIKITDGIMDGYKKTLNKILTFKPDVLAVSFLTVNAKGAYRLINQVKEILPNTFVVAGGVHATALPEDVLQNSNTDIVVLGEGEKIFCELVDKLMKKESLDGIAGTAFLRNGQIFKIFPNPYIDDLDTIPFPSYSLIKNIKQYKGWYLRKSRPETTILTSRGCKFNCSFCVNGIRGNFRIRSVGNIISELQMLKEKLGIREFFDQGSAFNNDLEWAFNFCRQMYDKKMGLVWKAQMRPENISYELAKDMVKAGCWAVLLGVESGNQNTLNNIGKNISLQKVEESCLILKKAGLIVIAMFMIFNFWEKDKELVFEGVPENLNTLKFARGLFESRLCDYISWAPAIPYPGTKLYEVAKRYNLIKKLKEWEDWNNVWNFVIELPGVTQNSYEMIKAMGIRLQIECVLKNLCYINLQSAQVFIKRGLKGMATYFRNKIIYG